jgi:hypothetical protein
MRQICASYFDHGGEMHSAMRDIRKRIVRDACSPPSLDTKLPTLDIPTIATVIITSEEADHPIEYVFDGQRGPGASCWRAAVPGEQCVIINFDTPQMLHQLVLDIEEPEVIRTQELLISVSLDGGRTYRDVVRQEYNFSPPGTTYERETWALNTDRVTHLAIRITPNKGGHGGLATLTSIMLV